GDTWFTFDGGASQQLTTTAQFDPASGNVQKRILDRDFATLANSSSASGTASVSVGPNNGPFYLVLSGTADDVYVSATTADVTERVGATVLVRSSTWGEPLLTRIADEGLGDGGYALPTTGQPVSLPWPGLDMISVRFDEGVTVRPGDMKLAAASGRTFDIRAFNYDWSTRTAHWTLAEPLGAENILLEVTTAAKAVDLGSPSGAHQQLRFSVLPGDVNGDGATTALDTVLVRNNSWSSVSSHSPTSLFDLTGDGAVNMADWRASMRLGFQRGPTEEVSSLALAPVAIPSPAASPAASSERESGRQSSVLLERVPLRASADRVLRPIAVDRALETAAPSLSRLRAARRRAAETID
ncbi:MAG: dockerin type I domain-containing protein, partial [Pirellulales bacterium]